MRRIQGPPFGPSPRGDKRRCRLLTWPATRRRRRLACRPWDLGASLSCCHPDSWHAGRGVASEAVRLVLAQAFGVHGLVRLEATARPENLGSVRVLTRNGFSVYGRSTRSLELGGAWWDLLHFERRAP